MMSVVEFIIIVRVRVIVGVIFRVIVGVMVVVRLW
jgi:hypothetical protein